MEETIEEVRLIALSSEAHSTVCGLVQPTDVVDPSKVFAADEVWAEIRSAFPAAEARPGEEEPAAPKRPPGAETARILVLNDWETFSALAGCRIYEVPAEWGIEEIEDALAKGPSRRQPP